MRHLLTIALSLGLMIPGIGWNQELKPVGTGELEALEAQGALVVDIRTAPEWKASGIIPGSYPLTFYDAEGRFDLAAFASAVNRLSTDSKRPVLLVCRSGHRSAEAGKLLASFWPERQVLHLDKGIQEWVREGRPTIAPVNRP